VEWNQVHYYTGHYWSVLPAQDDNNDECGGINGMTGREIWVLRENLLQYLNYFDLFNIFTVTTQLSQYGDYANSWMTEELEINS
jgi:hypothetical protein